MTASQKLPVVRLPEPYKTIYELQVLSIQQGIRHFRLRRATRPDDGTPPPESLDHASLRFTDLTEPDASRIPAEGNNSSWARAQRSPVAQFTWDGKDTPSVGQIWNVIYAILTLHTEFEIFRVLRQVSRCRIPLTISVSWSSSAAPSGREQAPHLDHDQSGFLSLRPPIPCSLCSKP